MKNRIYLSSPHMSDEGYEMQYIKEAFDTNWIAPLGPNVTGFEQELALKVGAKYAAALVSGRQRSILLLRLRELRREILFLSIPYFSATANPIILSKCNTSIYR